MEEEEVSLPGLRALGDLNTLIQKQLSVLTSEAKDEGTLLHSHPAGSLLPGQEDTRKGQSQPDQTLENHESIILCDDDQDKGLHDL